MLRPVFENGFETHHLVPAPSPVIKVMLDKAAEFMLHTKDLNHGMEHVNSLLRSANQFFRATGDRFSIDREVLLLALYWHDVWKSQNKPTPRNYLFHQFYEGLGSMFLFRKHARLAGLSPELIQGVSYAIRKHSAFQIRPAKTLEAQLLWDVDTLDVWNVQRVQAIFKNLKWTNLAFFDSYILYMKNKGFHLNFEWTKNEVKKRKHLFFVAMAQFRERLVNTKKSPEPLLVKSNYEG